MNRQSGAWKRWLLKSKVTKTVSVDSPTDSTTFWLITRTDQQAIETLLRLAEEYGGHAHTVGTQSADSVKGAHTDDALQNAEADLRVRVLDFSHRSRPILIDLKTLIERFANYTSLDDLFDSINQIYRDANQDPELKDWFKEVDTYIRKCLQEQGYIMQDSSTDEWYVILRYVVTDLQTWLTFRRNSLYDRGNFLLRNKYRGHTDRILDEIKFIGHQFDADPQNKAFGEAMQKLFHDLGNDEYGKPTFKPHLVKDLTEVIIPEFLINVRYIPIPRIEYSDPTIEVVVENLVVESDNLTPNVLEFSTDNYWRWDRKQKVNKNKNKVMLAVSGVQMDLRNVAYYVKRKKGFPTLQDTGVCDIFMGGQGLSFKIAAETTSSTDRQHFFKISKVDVDIKNVNIKMKRSNHKILFALAKPILLRALRPGIQKVLEKHIKDNAHQLDVFLFEVHREAKQAEIDAKNRPDPENVQNIYQRYITAARNRFIQAKQRTKNVVADKKANVAFTQHDSIFPQIKLPGGISTKATEYKELAAKGDKWESPIFSIGSAKESTTIPQPDPITHKSHGDTAPLTNGAAGLSNQMDRAFDDTENSAKVNGVTRS